MFRDVYPMQNRSRKLKDIPTIHNLQRSGFPNDDLKAKS